MTQLADDTVAHAEKIAESDECRSRLTELIDETMERDDQLEYIVATLHDEFIENNENIKNDVPVVGNLLEEAFDRRVMELYRDELESMLE